ncbi:MAG: biotin transporter BioY, partial [Gemmatimonadetes bacterium]|nr:biotin transporter BioY [Gemmatimonadota bacterium]
PTGEGNLPAERRIAAHQVLAVLGGVLLVALGAQAAIPLPMTPVPLTLQGPAVLVVGALLGPGLGAASMVSYLVLGAAGLPVFAPVGAPGIERLLGPTGGYLLAFPVAAAVVGHIMRARRSWLRLGFALVAGLSVIYAGGIAQLAALGGDMGTAWKLGSAPFLIADLCKLFVAGLVIRRFGPTTRALF